MKARVIEVDGERWINLAGFEEFLALIEDGFKRDTTYTGISIQDFLSTNRNWIIAKLGTMKLKSGFINL